MRMKWFCAGLSILVIAALIVVPRIRAASERQAALNEIRKSLVALKIAVRDGTTLEDLRKASNALSASVELHRKHFDPENLNGLHLYIKGAEFFWTQSHASFEYATSVQATWMLRILKPSNPEDDLHLAILREADPKRLIRIDWFPRQYVRKALARAYDEILSIEAKLSKA